MKYAFPIGASGNYSFYTSEKLILMLGWELAVPANLLQFA